MIQSAIRFAIAAHAGQLRKGTPHPYIEHPMHVGMLLSTAAMRQEIVVAGILHDVLEDTECTEKDIEEAFGTEVLALVKASSEPDKSLTWKERKQHTIDFLKDAPMDVQMIALCDKLSNLMAMEADLKIHGSELWKRFNAKHEEQKWYYESLAGVLSALKDQVLYQSFCGTVERVFGAAGQ